MANGLGIDEQLAAGESRTSDNGQYRLDMQQDGNLVLYRTSDNAPLWATMTNERGGKRAVMQKDGNLVVYGDSGPLWASDTSGHPGATLTVQDDGNVSVYESGNPLWATDTAAPAPVTPSASVTETVAPAPTEPSASEAAMSAPAAPSADEAASAYGTVVGSGLSRAYITKEGDRLEDLAAYFYGSPEQQQRIRDDNPDIANVSGPLSAGVRLAVSEDPNRGDAVAGASST
jgi:hypothetical protein